MFIMYFLLKVSLDCFVSLTNQILTCIATVD
nr:MAG TPA: hypothetical protein [Caudoviricetes sp.]